MDLVRKKKMKIKKLDDPTVREHGSSTIFIYFYIFLTKSLIQTQSKENPALSWMAEYWYEKFENQWQ